MSHDGYEFMNPEDPLSLNMYTYGHNNPLKFIDPSGNMAEVLSLAPELIALLLATGLLVYKNSEGNYVQITSLEELNFTIDSTAFDVSIDETNAKYRLDQKGKELLAEAQVKSTVSNLGNIAGKYKNLECEEAANAMKAHLVKNKLNGSLITIKYLYGPGWVFSESKGGDPISKNGVHMGILYEGNVYCNVHPLGLPKEEWLDDFVAVGQRTVIEIKF